MSLKKYKAKRDFKETSEPEGSSKGASGSLRFVVQKHAARRLHYDFRLECKGVLLSWAVPKGPSMDPQDKRLAIHVEDHPLDYQYFEGVIPKGNYGAGTVEIWDSGTFTVPQTENRKESEKALFAGLKKGHIIVDLHGNELEGEFVLQKLKQDADDNSWLLIKHKKLTKEQPKKKVKNALDKMPEFIPPMLATLVDKPFDNDDWLFEIKWDGFRALAFIERGNVQLLSRNKLSFNKQFPSIVDELRKVPDKVIFDGEIVVVDKKGKSDFQLLQNYGRGERKAGTQLCYYVFDLLYKSGEDLRSLALIERKEALKKYLNQLSLPLIRFNDHVLKKGTAFFKAALKEHLEGIIGKKISSNYQSRRSSDWVKIKTSMRQEVIICGFTQPRGSRKKFGALICGVYNEKNELQFAGHVGGGFNESLLDEVYRKLTPLIVKKCPLVKVPKVNTPVTWVKPKLIAEVSFAEWTKDDIMRQPIFQGLRNDKKIKEVKKEVPKDISSSNKISSNNGLNLTNLDKVYWPDEKYTKGDLLSYYEKIAPYIIPYLRNRPIMLHRYPDGIKGKDFYQKDISYTVPEGINKTAVQHEGKVDNYLVIEDVKSLLYAVNLGSIDLHPFLSQIGSIESPDFCVIDLDPHGISFDKVVEVALEMHKILDKIGVQHYCKTSGGKGLHILIPLQKGKYDYDQSKNFSELICRIVNKKYPNTTSLDIMSGNKAKKIFLDYMRNNKGQTVVAPYAVRPRPKAMVSTPLHWKEVNNRLDVSNFTIKTLPARLKKVGDILRPLLEKGVNLQAALKKLSQLL